MSDWETIPGVQQAANPWTGFGYALEEIRGRGRSGVAPEGAVQGKVRESQQSCRAFEALQLGNFDSCYPIA